MLSIQIYFSSCYLSLCMPQSVFASNFVSATCCSPSRSACISHPVLPLYRCLRISQHPTAPMRPVFLLLPLELSSSRTTHSLSLPSVVSSRFVSFCRPTFFFTFLHVWINRLCTSNHKSTRYQIRGGQCRHLPFSAAADQAFWPALLCPAYLRLLLLAR